jgi:hypothetical protein
MKSATKGGHPVVSVASNAIPYPMLETVPLLGSRFCI